MDTASSEVFRNDRGIEKFINEKFVAEAWHGTPNSFRKICEVFLFYIVQI